MTSPRWFPLLTTVFPRRAARARWRRLMVDPDAVTRPRGLFRALKGRVPTAGRRSTVAGGAAAAAMIGVVLAGPMAGLVLAVYAGTAVEVAGRRRTRLAHARSRR